MHTLFNDFGTTERRIFVVFFGLGAQIGKKKSASGMNWKHSRYKMLKKVMVNFPFQRQRNYK